jgi:hypothetical protein
MKDPLTSQVATCLLAQTANCHVIGVLQTSGSEPEVQRYYDICLLHHAGTEGLQVKVAVDDSDAMPTHVTLTSASAEAHEGGAGSSRDAEHNHNHFLNDLATKRVLWVSM